MINYYLLALIIIYILPSLTIYLILYISFILKISFPNIYISIRIYIYTRTYKVIISNSLESIFYSIYIYIIHIYILSVLLIRIYKN